MNEEDLEIRLTRTSADYDQNAKATHGMCKPPIEEQEEKYNYSIIRPRKRNNKKKNMDH